MFLASDYARFAITSSSITKPPPMSNTARQHAVDLGG
jgi:hypothetical protein